MKRNSINKFWLTIVLALGVCLAVPAVLAKGNACKTTTKSALKACLAEAKADYAIALANCANLSDVDEQKECRAEAKEELKEAIEDCRDQAEARADACERLGPDPYDPVIDPANFGGPINNMFLPLVPGTTFVYVSPSESNVVEVTHNTRTILGVECVEVHDTVYEDGELVEDTLDWFAQDLAGNVWYFGENSVELEDDLLVSLEGSWIGGVDGAKPGIIMKANPMLGDFYRQEFSVNNAEDLAEVTGLNEMVNVPAGNFAGCLKTHETTPLEPDASENKFYAPGIGFVFQVDLESGEELALVQIIGP